MNRNSHLQQTLFTAIRSLVFGAPPPYVPSTRWGAPQAILATAAIVVLAPLAGYAAAQAYAFATGMGVPGSVAPGGFERQLLTYEAIYTASLNVAMIALTVMAASRYGDSWCRVLALAPPAPGIGAYILMLAAALGVTAIWFGSLLLVRPDLVIEDFKPYRELMSRERSWLMPPIYCLLSPIAEEFLFRGFLISALARSRMGLAGAALLSSLAWTALHVDRTDLARIQIFAAGLFLAWLLIRSGSLRVPILCHAAFNIGVSFMVIVLRLPA